MYTAAGPAAVGAKKQTPQVPLLSFGQPDQYACISIYVYVYICMYVDLYICVCMYVYIDIDICIFVCVYI